MSGSVPGCISVSTMLDVLDALLGPEVGCSQDALDKLDDLIALVRLLGANTVE